MDRNFSLIAAAILAIFSPSAFAAYASASSAVKVVTTSGTQRALVRAAANDLIFEGATARAAAVVNVGGRSVTMPAVARIAANAPRIMAAAAYVNPALMIAGGAALAYALYTSEGFKVLHDQWVKEIPGCDENGCPYWTFKYYDVATQTYKDGSHYSTLSQAASGFANASSGCRSSGTSSTCYTVTVVSITAPNTARFRSVEVQHDSAFTPPYHYEGEPVFGDKVFDQGIDPGGSSIQPVTQTEFEQAMADKPISPLTWPSFPPSLPIPIESDPVLNPEVAPEPAPAPMPRPAPMRVPVSDPIPIPDTVPQQWKTPAVDIVPSPTVSDPFRVDLRPVDITKTTAEPLPDQQTIPNDTPPDPDAQVKPKDESKLGLCELFPDILACAKPELDTPDAPDLPQQNKEITLAPDSGWGAGGGSCPAPRHLSGANIDFSFDPLCDGLSKFRPLLLAFAWIAAAFIIAGQRQGGDA